MNKILPILLLVAAVSVGATTLTAYSDDEQSITYEVTEDNKVKLFCNPYGSETRNYTQLFYIFSEDSEYDVNVLKSSRNDGLRFDKSDDTGILTHYVLPEGTYTVTCQSSISDNESGYGFPYAKTNWYSEKITITYP